jgi:serine/threonine-protein kinase
VERSAAGAIAGTPLYLSPEAISNPGEMDGRADIYQLGAVAYFLLTGSPVFDSENVVEVCAAHLHQAPIAPSLRLGEEIPEVLEDVVLRCLAKNPADRFDAEGLIDAVADLDIEPWTDDRARAWWRSSKEVITAHLEGKRAGAASLGPVTLALLRQSDEQAA